MSTPLRLAGIAGFVLVWGGLIYGSTQIHAAEHLLGGHSICGPWGCGPPTSALLGAHGLWMSLLAPGLGLICRMLAGPTGMRLAKASLVLGATATFGLFLVAAVAWLRAHGAEYAVQRGLFFVATTPDVVGIPLMAGGLLGLIAARKPKSIAGMQERPVETVAAGRENLAV